MKTIFKIAILAFAAVWMAACGAPATNTNTYTNTNTTKPTAAAPTADALLALDKQANEAYIKSDSNFFEGMLSDKFIMHEGGQRMDKTAVTKMIAGNLCDVKTWNLEDPQMAKIDADTYVLSYKGTFDGTCTTDGKTDRVPSPVRAATVWVRSGDKWRAAFHGENLIIDPENPPPPPAKAERKKKEPKKDDKAAANSNTAATQPAADPRTDAMMASEKSLWEAWKVRDSKTMEDLTTRDLSFLNIFGAYFANKADTMKSWTGGAKCEIKSVSLTDAAGTMVSPTVGILTFKGTTDGTCGGQKVGVTWGVAIYVKDGDAWKYAFGMNQPHRRG